jgi:hypothetical protein
LEIIAKAVSVGEGDVEYVRDADEPTERVLVGVVEKLMEEVGDDVANVISLHQSNQSIN